jgi:hypothetical protein
MSPPSLDYIMTTTGILDEIFSLELYKECGIVSVFSSKGEFLHHL